MNSWCFWAGLPFPRLEIIHLSAAFKHFLNILNGNRCGQCWGIVCLSFVSRRESKIEKIMFWVFNFHMYRYEAIYLNISVTDDHVYMYKLHPEIFWKLFIRNGYNLDEREIPIDWHIIYFICCFCLTSHFTCICSMYISNNI